MNNLKQLEETRIRSEATSTCKRKNLEQLEVLFELPQPET